MSTAAPQVFATRLSYAQGWEDPRLLRAALAVGPGDDVFSIAAAGDNTLALLGDGPDSVVAVDLSGPQLAVAELKAVAPRLLPLDSYRALLGLDGFGRRLWFYHYVRDALSPRARSHLDALEPQLRAGLLGAGRFESYLARFRTQVLPRVVGQAAVDALLAAPDLAAQAAVYDAQWDHWRWRALFRVFFSRPVMARAGRSPEHFRFVEGAVGDVFLGRARHALRGLPVADNPFVQWMLAGRFSDLERAHPYLSAAGHAATAAAAGRLTLLQGEASAVLEAAPPGRFSAFNFSNIFEYLSEADTARVWAAALRAARPGARFAWWSLLVPRPVPDAFAGRVRVDAARAAALHAQDRAFVYGSFTVAALDR
jgi:S-adenosylmethionine-diacylglycerol 3-amino-3-carboxypropyl transferase